MVTAEDYNVLYDQYQQLQDVAAVLFLILLVVLGLCFYFFSRYVGERGQRRKLQNELDRHHDPTHQLAIIQSLGAAGREELRQIVSDVEQALATAAGGSRS